MTTRHSPFTTLSVAERLELTEDLLSVTRNLAAALGCDLGYRQPIILTKHVPTPAGVVAALHELNKYGITAASVTGTTTALRYPEPFDQSFPPPKKQ